MVAGLSDLKRCTYCTFSGAFIMEDAPDADPTSRMKGTDGEDGPAAATGSRDRRTAEELKAKLRGGELTSNQRRKLRKKLSKLFHVSGADSDSMGGVPTAASDFSGQADDAPAEWDGQHADASICMAAPAKRPAAGPRNQACKRHAPGVGGSGISCSGMFASESRDSANVQSASMTVPQNPAVTPEASGSAGPGPGSTSQAVHQHIAKLPIRAPHTRGPAADMSRVMHMISAELKSTAGAASAGGSGSIPGAKAASNSFCRVNMSQEMSVITAELSTSVAGCVADTLHSSGDQAVPCGSAPQVPQQKCCVSLHQIACVSEAADVPVQVCEASAEARVEQSHGRQPSKPKKQFVFGNYHNYYGYREMHSFDEDPRLRLFRSEWFRGRDVLDIGCNEGLVTLAVAGGFGCGRTTGVDIDATLIKFCMSNLRDLRVQLRSQLPHNAPLGAENSGMGRRGHAIITALTPAITMAAGATHAQVKLSMAGSAAGSRDINESCIGSPLHGVDAASDAHGLGSLGDATEQPWYGAGLAPPGPCSSTPARPRPSQFDAVRFALKSLGRTTFKRQDWVRVPAREQTYDTLMCLSVTKWVHLNGGDAALKKLFRKMHDSLVPGGLLVLEPQQWRSYESAVRKPQTARDASGNKRNLDALALRPDGFIEHLHHTHGLVLLEDLNASSSSFHFDRPVYVLQRPPAMPRQLLPLAENFPVNKLA